METTTKKLFLIIFLFSLPVVFFSCQTVPPVAPPIEHEQPLVENEHILYGFPSTDCQILYRSGYVLCHDNEEKVADWASYHLAKGYLEDGVSRSDDFRADPDLSEGERSELSDYRGSGFDRGHLVPAADMARTSQIMSESFLLSNMAPQKPGFNRGIWKVLEEKVRDLTRDKGNVYVMTGSLFLTENNDAIGTNRVGVPSHFYKIIIAGDRESPASLQAVAFIIPNDSFPADELNNFIVTIDKVEEESELDFMHDLDDSVEDVLESQDRLSSWFEV